MNRKNSNGLLVLPIVAAILFFAARGNSARTQLPAIEIPPAQQAGQSIEGFWQGALAINGETHTQVPAKEDLAAIA